MCVQRACLQPDDTTCCLGDGLQHTNCSFQARLLLGQKQDEVVCMPRSCAESRQVENFTRIYNNLACAVIYGTNTCAIQKATLSCDGKLVTNTQAHTHARTRTHVRTNTHARTYARTHTHTLCLLVHHVAYAARVHFSVYKMSTDPIFRPIPLDRCHGLNQSATRIGGMCTTVNPDTLPAGNGQN